MWFREDLQRILLSINAASAATARCNGGAHVSAYRQGFQEALEAVAVALGIPPSQVGVNSRSPEERAANPHRSTGSDPRRLLDAT